jgi:uncharacterized coiled-coil protein SlyX
MKELEKRLDDLELSLLKEVTELTKDSTEVWNTIDTLINLIRGLTKDFKELRVDVDKLIENSCGFKKPA